MSMFPQHGLGPRSLGFGRASRFEFGSTCACRCLAIPMASGQSACPRAFYFLLLGNKLDARSSCQARFGRSDLQWQGFFGFRAYAVARRMPKGAAIAQLGGRQTEDLKFPDSIPGLGKAPASRPL